MRKSAILGVMLASLIVSCQPEADEAYLNEIADFRQSRIDYLQSEEGYLNLAGLYWMEEGSFTFGSDTTNQIQFPASAPAFMGTFIRQGDSVFMTMADDVSASIDDQLAVGQILIFDGDSIQHAIDYNNFKWFGIKRGEEIGIRLRDFKHPSINQLTYIDAFEPDPEYRVKADWEQYPEPKKLKMPNQTGQIVDMECYGAFHFVLKGKPYTLEPVGELYNNEYFLMIYDATSGEETYGSGRYMYIAQPDASGKAVIDFNKAFNPPCVFTEFATCLFPHEANRLPIRLEAGEKYTGY